MRVGLTYDLRSDYLREGYSLEETAEFDKEETIEGLESAIRANGHKPERIGHARALIQRLAKGERWDLVFNIAEGLRGIAREAQVPAILDVYGIPCVFSDAAVLTLCLHKGYTKAVLREAGVATAPFKVIERLSDIASVDMSYPLFVKPVAEGTGKGVSPKSIVRTKAELKPAVAALLEKFKQPVLVEPYLSGREFTVGILGSGQTTRTVGAMEQHKGHMTHAVEINAVTRDGPDGRNPRAGDLLLPPRRETSRHAPRRRLPARRHHHLHRRWEDGHRHRVRHADPADDQGEHGDDPAGVEDQPAARVDADGLPGLGDRGRAVWRGRLLQCGRGGQEYFRQLRHSNPSCPAPSVPAGRTTP